MDHESKYTCQSQSLVDYTPCSHLHAQGIEVNLPVMSVVDLSLPSARLPTRFFSGGGGGGGGGEGDLTDDLRMYVWHCHAYNTSK